MRKHMNSFRSYTYMCIYASRARPYMYKYV